MSDLDKQKSPPKDSIEGTVDVIETCETPRMAQELTSHFLGTYFAIASMPTELRQDDEWKQRTASAQEDVAGKLRKLAAQMDKHNYPDISSRIREICELVAQPFTHEIGEDVGNKNDELREHVRS